MPVRVISKIKQQNDALFPIFDDIDLEGGFRVVADIAERDEYAPGEIRERFAKPGSWFKVVSDGNLYELDSFGVFQEITFSVGGGGFTPGAEPVLVTAALEITLLAATPVDGSIGWAEDTETMFIRNASTWSQVPKVKLYANTAARLADTNATARTIGIETDTGLAYYFDHTGSPDIWNPIAVEEIDGGTYA